MIKEDQADRQELGLQQARPAPHERPEPSAAPQVACAGNNISIAVGITNVAMTNTSIRPEDTGCIPLVKWCDAIFSS
jgi:hypothetical protein